MEALSSKYWRRMLAPLVAVVMLTVMPCAKTAFAQSVVSGDVQGTVTDPSGAIVPNASVTIRSAQTGETHTTTSSANGSYRFSFLKPGTYDMTVSATGFSEFRRQVVVAVGQSTPTNVSLGVATQSQTVEVTADVPVVQTDNGNIATSYSTQQIETLPNPGNDMTYVAQTAPGVAQNTSGGGYGNFTAFGLPANSNLFTVNGNDDMDPYLNLNNSGASNLMLGANELSEAAVVNNGYTGQYGRQVGSNVNYTTKSGSNAFHGNAIYWWNGTALNANEYFTKQAGEPRPAVNAHQWAGSIGGPVIHDRLFFFVDDEGLRDKLPTSEAVFVPSPAFQSAVLTRLATANPAAVPFYRNLFSLYNAAPGIAGATPASTSHCGNFTGLPAGTPCALTFRSTAGNQSQEWILSGRVDMNITNNDRVFLRYKTDHGVQPTFTDPINPAFNATSTQPQHEGQLNWTHVLGSTAVNQFVLSGMHYSALFQNVNQSAATALFPYALTFSNFTGLGGTNFSFPQGRNVSQAQVVDDVSFTRGAHNLKFGVNWRGNRVNDYTFGVLTTPLVSVTSGSATNLATGMAGFASGNVTSFRERFPSSTAQMMQLYSLGFYGQDQWRMSKRFSVTLALRADRNSNAECLRNCFARMTSPFWALQHSASTPYNQSIRTGLNQVFPNLEAIAWQPRIGFAMTPWRSDRTPVIRGGVGLFADLYPATLVDRFARNSPMVNEFRATGTATTSYGLAPGAANSAATVVAGWNQAFLQQFANGGTLASIQSAVPGFTPPAFNSVSNNIVNPKWLEWNLEVEQQVGQKGSLSLNYVGNHGYDIFVLNPGLNAFCTAAACPGGFAGLPAAAPDPRFGTVTDLRNRAVSNYNGLTASFQEKFGRLNLQANYTWSHTLDEVSNGGIEAFSSADSLLVQLNPNSLASLNYGNADYDIRHYFSASYSWDTGFHVGNRFLNQIVGGWVWSGAFFTRTGLPFTVIDASATSTITNFTGGIVTPAVAGTSAYNVQCNNPNATCFTGNEFTGAVPGTGIVALNGFGNERRNQFRGPGYFDSDMSLVKNFAITERLRLGLGATAFNIFNHPNFANPDYDISSPTFGQILSTVSPATSPYGAFVGAAASGRILQLQARITF